MISEIFGIILLATFSLLVAVSDPKASQPMEVALSKTHPFEIQDKASSIETFLTIIQCMVGQNTKFRVKVGSDILPFDVFNKSISCMPIAPNRVMKSFKAYLQFEQPIIDQDSLIVALGHIFSKPDALPKCISVSMTKTAEPSLITLWIETENCEGYAPPPESAPLASNSHLRHPNKIGKTSKYPTAIGLGSTDTG